MAFDVTNLLGNLFGGATLTPAAAVPELVAAPEVVVPEPVPRPEAVDTVGDPLAAFTYADWVQRSDSRGRVGWEAPDLPECERWWARWDFNDLPAVPEGFCWGGTEKPAPQDCAGGVSGSMVDKQDLDNKRPLQGQLRGFGGA